MRRGILRGLIAAGLLLGGVCAGAQTSCDDYNRTLHWLPHTGLDPLSGESVIIDGGIAFVTDDDLAVFDLGDPDAPQLVATLPGSEAAADKAGDILVCMDSYDMQLVDVSDPEHPFLRGRIETFSRCLAADGDLAVATNWRNGRDYFQVYDISNPDAPVRIREMNVTSVTSRCVDIEGALAFVAYSNTSGDAFLQPIDLSDPANPALLAPLDETGNWYFDIELIGDRLYSVVYPGLLRVMDVGDPAAPLLLGSAAFEAGDPRLAVAGVRAYVADGPLRRMTVIDLSDETDPRTRGHLDSRFEARGVAAASGRAYVVGQPYGFEGYQPAWLRVADVTSPDLPAPIGQLALDADRDVVVTGGLAYVIGSPGLQIVDLADPTAPALLSTTDLGGTPQAARAFIVADGIGYALVQAAVGDLHLRVLDLGDPAAPAPISDIALPGDYLHDLVKAGNHLCVAQRTYVSMGYWTFLTMVDVSDPAAPAVTSTVNVEDFDYGYDIHLCLAGDGKHLFYGRDYSPGEIAVMDIGDPNAPFTVNAYDTENEFHFLQRDGDRLVVSTARSAGALDEGVILWLDCGDPTQMTEVATLTLARAANEIVLSGGFPADAFYLASYLEGLLACTSADPGAPAHLGTWSLPVSKLADAGGYLVGIQDFFGLLTIPYHCDLTAVTTAPPPAGGLAAWPNPFNPVTTLRFELPRPGPVRLAIHDLSGRLVRTLVAETLASGHHEATWNGRDEKGRAQASGLYFARLETRERAASVKLVLLK